MTTPPSFVFGSFGEGEAANLLGIGPSTKAPGNSSLQPQAGHQKTPGKQGSADAAPPVSSAPLNKAAQYGGRPPGQVPVLKSKLSAASPPFQPGAYLSTYTQATPQASAPIIAPVTPINAPKPSSLPKATPTVPPSPVANGVAAPKPSEGSKTWAKLAGSAAGKGTPKGFANGTVSKGTEGHNGKGQEQGKECTVKGQEQKVNGQEQNVNGQEQNVEGQENIVKGQEQSAKGQEQNVKGQEQNVKGQEQNVKGQEQNIKGQEIKERGHHQTVEGQEQSAKGQEGQDRAKRPEEHGAKVQEQSAKGLQQDLLSQHEDEDVAASLAPPRSWAALLTPDGGPGQVSSKSAPPKANGGLPKEPALFGGDFVDSMRLAEERGPRRVAPRGLLNTGNSCFVNSTLQALLACSPFLHLLQQLDAKKLQKSAFPTLSAFVDFVSRFEPLPPVKPQPRRPIIAPPQSQLSPHVEVDRPFAPVMFSDVLQRFSPAQVNPPQEGTRSAKGLRARSRQEDAQEFLSFLMDRMHEELLRLEKEEHPLQVFEDAVSDEQEEDEEWETVGPKNRSAVTRTHSHQQTALTEIFGGQLQSVVKTKGNRASATIQPFTLLQLDIVPESVFAVEDALQLLAAPETLDGYRSKGHAEVTASKVVKLQVLPRVLILHLMRFTYSGHSGMAKLHKTVKYPPTLTLPAKILAAAPAPPIEGRRYELIATVSHHGKDPSGGHYTADAVQPDGRWLRYDDGQVSVVGLGRVLNEQAYLLVYKRLAV